MAYVRGIWVIDNASGLWPQDGANEPYRLVLPPSFLRVRPQALGRIDTRVHDAAMLQARIVTHTPLHYRFCLRRDEERDGCVLAKQDGLGLVGLWPAASRRHRVASDSASCTTFTPASLYDPCSYTMKPQELTHKPRARSRR